MWKRSRFDGVRPGEVFRPDLYRYKFYGHRKRLSFGYAAGGKKFAVEALEFEPLSRPDRAHVYLLLPVYPADHTTVSIGLPQVIAALAEEFQLLSHLQDWPDDVPGCGIVVALAGPDPGWWKGWPWASPGIEVPVKWLRGIDAFDARLRSQRHEASAEDVAACLNTTLPVWPAATNEASVVATWQPGDRPAVCPIPADRTDYWLACRYAAQEAIRLPGCGFTDLAVKTHQAIVGEAVERNDIIDADEARPWTPAALIAPPEHSAVYESSSACLLNAAHLLLGSAGTPVGVGRAVIRLFSDPMRGDPVVVPIQSLPVECLDYVREAPVSLRTSPRTRHLLDAATNRTGHNTWQLHEDRRNGVLYLYALNATHMAWLPVGDRLHPQHSHELLPDMPDTAHLTRDSAGSLGGWVRGVDETFTPLPNMNGRTGIVQALAAIITGRAPKLGATGHRLQRLLQQIPENDHRVIPWHQLRSYAEELEWAEPRQAARTPFCSGDEVLSEESTNASTPMPRGEPPERVDVGTSGLAEAAEQDDWTLAAAQYPESGESYQSEGVVAKVTINKREIARMMRDMQKEFNKHPIRVPIEADPQLQSSSNPFPTNTTINNNFGVVFHGNADGAQVALNNSGEINQQQHQGGQVTHGYEPLAQAVALVMQGLAKVELTDDDRHDAEEAAGEIIAEVTTEEPDPGKIRRATKVLKGVLAPIGAGLAAATNAEVQEWARTAIDQLGSAL